MTSGFSSGTTYYFKVQAFNEFGESPMSAPILVITASVPVQLALPTVALAADPLFVDATWAVTSDARGSPVTQYRVKFRGSDNLFYIPTGTPCDPATPVTTTTCSVLMSVLTSAPYSLAAGATIVARVEAYNAIGYSTPSASSVAALTAITGPTVAPTLARGSLASSTVIDLTWLIVSGSPATGGSAVTSYELYRGTTSGTLEATVLSTAPLQHTTSAGVAAGTTYTYYIRAINAYGNGVFSAAFTITAASAPSALVAGATTSLSGSTVLVQWAAATALNDSPLTAYIIEFYSPAAPPSWVEVAGCNGRSGTVLANAQCNVPMSVFTGPAFVYPLSGLILVRVSVQNAIGTSAASPTNAAGVSAQDVPTSAPTLVKDALTSDLQVKLTWTGLATGAATGYSAVTNYKLYHDDGTNTSPLAFLASTGGALAYVHTPVTSGATYRYQIRAANVFGDGTISDPPLSVLAAAVPT